MVWDFKYVICWKMIQLSVSDWSYAERRRRRPRMKGGQPKNCLRNFLNGFQLNNGRQRPYTGATCGFATGNGIIYKLQTTNSKHCKVVRLFVFLDLLVVYVVWHCWIFRFFAGINRIFTKMFF